MNSAGGAGNNSIDGRHAASTDARIAAPPQRVVILGASNVIRNISTILATAELFRGQPLDFLAAAGHGRSYGLTSCVLGRSLPAIRACALWETLSERPQVPTVSLVTDVGNDLLYGASVAAIVSWVEECLTKLAQISDRVILTELPLENIARLNSINFFLFRTILFPKSKLTLAAAREMSEALNERIAHLASVAGVTLIKPDMTWYGADPIHIHRRHRNKAWRQILQPWQTKSITPLVAPPRAERIPLRECRPHLRSLMGIVQRRDQPTLRMTNGTQVSFF